MVDNPDTLQSLVLNHIADNLPLYRRGNSLADTFLHSVLADQLLTLLSKRRHLDDDTLRLFNGQSKTAASPWVVWTVGLVDRWSGGQLVGWTVGRVDSWMGGQMVGWTDGRVDSLSGGQVVRWTVGRVDSCTDYCSIYAIFHLHHTLVELALIGNSLDL